MMPADPRDSGEPDAEAQARRVLEITMRLDETELTRLARLEADLLATLHESADGDPSSTSALRRLFPDAYPDDAESSDEFRSLTHSDLADSKTENASRVLAALLAGAGEQTTRRRRTRREIRLDADLAQTLLRNLSDVRLLLAERLGIDHDEDTGHAGAAYAADRAAYEWLGMMQESLVGALYGLLDDTR